MAIIVSLIKVAAVKQMAECEALAEKSYSEMYDSRNPRVCYCELKDYFVEAIGAAERAGLMADVKRLTKRLEHCMQVFRGQFGDF
jgi:hypothetical protein